MSPQGRAEPQIFGVEINCLSWKELEERCVRALNGAKPIHIVTVNGEILLKALANNRYAEILNDADLVIPDSTNVACVLALKGSPVKNITAGADLVSRLSIIAAARQKSVYLLGAKAGIAAKAATRLQKMSPGLIIAGVSNADPDDSKGLKRIRDSRADIILVAYGAPKQEEWIARHKHQSGARLLIGIGGTLDMLAGVTPRAPQIIRSVRLEWLWRLILQPSRIGRIWQAVIIFPIKALFSS